MFEKKDEISDAVAAMLKYCSGLNRGEVVTYDDFNSVCGMHREHQSWSAFKRRFMRDLQQSRGIAIRAVYGVGYKLLYSDEQVIRCSRERQERAARQCYRGASEVASVDSSELTDHLIKTRVKQIDSLNRARSESLKALRVLNASFASETLPRRHIAQG